MRRRLAFALATLLCASAAADPRIDYMLQCQGCHLADGGGKPGAVPALRGSVGRFLAAPGGREFLVRVPGSSQSPLSDARLAAVLNWVLEHFDPGHLPPDFTPFTADEVARVRRPPLTDVESARRALLKAASESGE